MADQDEIFNSLVAQGIDPADARARSDAAAMLREQNKPQPLDLKDVYSKSKAKDPRPPAPGDHPPGWSQAIFDGLVEKGYRKDFADEVASRGYTFEHSVELAEHDRFLRGLYKKTDGGKR